MEKLSNNELKQLNKAQLISLLNQIDRKKYAAYANKIQSYIHSEDILTQHFVKKENGYSKFNIFKDKLPPWSHLVLAGLLFLMAFYIHLTGKLPMIGTDLTAGDTNFTKISLVVICIGSGFLSIVHYFNDKKS